MSEPTSQFILTSSSGASIDRRMTLDPNYSLILTPVSSTAFPNTYSNSVILPSQNSQSQLSSQTTLRTQSLSPKPHTAPQCSNVSSYNNRLPSSHLHMRKLLIAAITVPSFQSGCLRCTLCKADFWAPNGTSQSDLSLSFSNFLSFFHNFTDSFRPNSYLTLHLISFLLIFITKPDTMLKLVLKLPWSVNLLIIRITILFLLQESPSITLYSNPKRPSHHCQQNSKVSSFPALSVPQIPHLHLQSFNAKKVSKLGKKDTFAVSDAIPRYLPLTQNDMPNTASFIIQFDSQYFQSYFNIPKLHIRSYHCLPLLYLHLTWQCSPTLTSLDSPAKKRALTQIRTFVLFYIGQRSRCLAATVHHLTFTAVYTSILDLNN